MILYIVRHAWAADPGDPAWPDDRQRPLTAEGRQRFVAVAKRLAQRGLAPELIATSPLVRCHQTAEILAKELGRKRKIVPLEALAPGSDLGQLVHWTNHDAAKCGEVAWVGHAPDVDRLTAALIGDGRASIQFSKGAVAAVEFDGPVQPATGQLRWLVTAKLLGC